MKIKILLFENHRLNLSKMFSGCTSLIKFYEISTKEYPLKGIANNVQINEKKLISNENNDDNLVEFYKNINYEPLNMEKIKKNFEEKNQKDYIYIFVHKRQMINLIYSTLK